VERKVMKIVYRVLAGFFWIMIPISWFIGLLYSIYGNSELVSIVFGYSGALMFFILGIIVLLLGREKGILKPFPKEIVQSVDVRFLLMQKYVRIVSMF
jgi:hypothetical protein